MRVHFVTALGNIAKRCKYSHDLGEGYQRVKAADDNLGRRSGADRGSRIILVWLEVIRGLA